MPRRSKLVLLPDDLRRQLDARLLDAGTTYATTVAWLEEQGVQIKKSALADYAAQLRNNATRLEAAKARLLRILRGPI